MWPFLLLLPSLFAQEIIVDDQDGSPGFTTTGDDWTTWATNGYGYDGGDSEYHYLSHTLGGSDRRGTATWTPELPQVGTYVIEAWFRLTENRTRDADHVVTDGHGGTHNIVIDQYGEGPSGWVSLGEYWCRSGSGGCTVILDGTDDDQSDEANAMRFTLLEPGDSTEEPEPEPGDEVEDCDDFPGLGTHSQTAYASAVDGVDWVEMEQAIGGPDGKEASTPNVDAGEFLLASGWELCDPVGEETLDSVTLEALARTQYDSGPYELRLQLDGEDAAATVFSGTSLDWYGVDLTGDRSAWTWAAAKGTRGRITLHDQPGGNRDSDAWVDAWRLTVGFTTTADEEGRGTDTEPDTGDTSSEDEDPVDSVLPDTGDTGEEGRPPDPVHEEETKTASECGCGQFSGGTPGLAWLLGLVVLVRRRPRACS